MRVYLEDNTTDPIYFMKLKTSSDPLYKITPINGWPESGIVNGRISLYFYIPEDEEQVTYFNIGSTGVVPNWGWIYSFYFYKKTGTDIGDGNGSEMKLYNLMVPYMFH